MGLFGNLTPDQIQTMMGLGGAAQGFGQAAMPTRVPTPFGAVLAQGASGLVNGLGANQQYQAQNMQNQQSALNLDTQKTLHPLIMQNIKNMMGGDNTPSQVGGQSSPADGMFRQAYNMALATGDMGKAAEIAKSWAETSPALAGAKTSAEQGETWFKTPQGTYVKGKNMGAGTGAPVANPAPPSDATPPKRPVLAKDGKPIIPNQTNLFPPDASGTPKYNTPNTDTGVALTKDMQTSDLKANDAFTANANSLQTEQFRLKELENVYKDVQSGTLTAQNPELANKLIAWGVIKDPKEISNLSKLQSAMQNHALQIINQVKDTNANFTGTPSRLLATELSELQEKGENTGAQPEALWNIIGQARGVVDHSLDMVKGWDALGGLGNRAANGYTLRPDDYARKFIQFHDIEDYKKQAQTEMGPFKGMVTNNGANIPSSAIQHLKANPNLASQFQSKYGVDPKQYLGQ